MGQRIVVALDPDAIAPEAIELGHTLACATGARLTLIAVSHADRPVTDADLGRIRERLRSRGNDDVAAHLIVAPSIDRALHRAAEREDTGMVVLGPSHRGAAGRALARTTAAHFLHGAPCPVAIAPPEYLDPERSLERIGVGFVDTPDGHEALRGAAALARWTGASLQITGVAEIGLPEASLMLSGSALEEVLAEQRRVVRAAMGVAAARLGAGVECELVVHNADPAGRLAEASSGVDLLVCGSRGRGPLGSVLLGSVTQPLIHRARCPLLIVPRGRTSRLQGLLGGASAAAL
jgi:nucleotide-binding universal stress UspA family protein